MRMTPATTVWEKWRGAQRRKRILVSWGSTSGAALVLVAALFLGFGPRFNVGEQGEAIAVKLGNPNGEDLPLQVSAVPDQALQALVSAQREVSHTTVQETRLAPSDVLTVPEPAPKASTKISTKTPVHPEAKPQTQTPPPPVKSPVVTEKVIRGVEKGNSSELILKPQGEKVSQNAYWPVYLFMPLPQRIDAALLNKIPATDLYSVDERKALLLQSYKRSGSELVLSGTVDLPVRPALWQILEAAGYDVSNADYKRGKNLQPVVISFKLGTPPGGDGNPPLSEIRLEQSSGSQPVDDAVLYAFQLSTFANGTGQVVQGRYTYDFQEKK